MITPSVLGFAVGQKLASDNPQVLILDDVLVYISPSSARTWVLADLHLYLPSRSLPWRRSDYRL